MSCVESSKNESGIQLRLQNLSTRNRIAFIAFIAFILEIFNSYIANRALYYRSPYNLGDWLINYHSGFVRRGLTGELFSWIASLHPGLVGKYVIGFQLLVLLATGAAVLYLASDSKSKWTPYILLSPAGFIFGVYCLDGAFRKEILLFVTFAALAIASRTKTHVAKRWVWVSFIFLAATMLSWEAAVFVLPTLWFLLGFANVDPKDQKRMRSLFTIVSVLLFGVSSIFHGSVNQASAICHYVVSTHQALPAVCNGAIGDIALSPKQNFLIVWHDYPKYFTYILWYAWSLTPFILSGWIRRYWKISLALSLSTACFFASGTDYGRWIHIVVVALSFMYLVTPERNNHGEKYRWYEIIFLTFWTVGWFVPFSFNPNSWAGLYTILWNHLSHPGGFYYPFWITG
jgi:hypothetical protein